MALALYSDVFWFPSGVLASAVPARVFPVGSNGLAPLWADAAGTVPLPNPLNTDGGGNLTFYATVGQYWVHMDSESFLIDVGLSQEQADLSTGVASGLNLDINAGNPQAVDIAPFIGYIVDNTDALSIAPTITRVDYAGGTVALDAGGLSRPFTFLLMDGSQNITQQATYPTPDQFRTRIFLGAVLYDTAGGQIIEVQTLPTILPQQGTQFVDLLDALGAFSTSGNVVSPNGVNLMFNKTSGTLFARAFNYVTGGGVYTDDPHRAVSPAHTPASFRRTIRTVSIPTPPLVTTIDPANYDLNGVLTPVGGGTNASTIQRIFLFPTSTTSAQITVQYGQSQYSSLTAAVDAVGTGTFVSNPINALGTLIGYLCVIRTATNLSDPTQAVFINAHRFALP